MVVGAPNEFANTGTWVSIIGDINGDHIDDMALGATFYRNYSLEGYIFVIFGRCQFPAVFNLTLLDGNNGFVIPPNPPSPYLQRLGDINTIAPLGDVNGDNLADFIVGAWGTGKAYIIYGSQNFHYFNFPYHNIFLCLHPKKNLLNVTVQITDTCPPQLKKKMLLPKSTGASFPKPLTEAISYVEHAYF